MDWEWSGIFESIVGGAILAVALWLIKRMVSWARTIGPRNREELPLQYPIINFSTRIYGRPVIIGTVGVVGTVLFFSLLRFVLVSYHPILWHDFLVVFGYVSSSIFLLYFGMLFTLVRPDSVSGKERIKLIGVMIMLVMLAIFSTMYSMHRDDLFSRANLERLTDAINEKNHQHFVQELKSLYPRLREYGLLTPSIEPVRTGKSVYDRTWYEYHLAFLKALRRQLRDGTFDLDQWNIDVQREDKKRKDFLKQTE